MGELPEDAIEAAVRALTSCAWTADITQLRRILAETALAAALPFLERATRDKIAAEIEIEGAKFFVEARRDGYRSAARVARGGEATE